MKADYHFCIAMLAASRKSSVAWLLLVGSKRMQIFAQNRHELFLSAAMFLASFLVAHIYDYAEGAGRMLIVVVVGFRFMALLSATNAFADQRRMLPGVRVLCVPWFLCVLYFTGVAIWQCIRFEPYIPSDR
jgi:hypothetical protein